MNDNNKQMLSADQVLCKQFKVTILVLNMAGFIQWLKQILTLIEVLQYTTDIPWPQARAHLQRRVAPLLF